MSPDSKIYKEIAARFRSQELSPAPVDHQREEVLYHLCGVADAKMREFAVSELNRISSGRCCH